MAKLSTYLSVSLVLVILLCMPESWASLVKTASENPALDRVFKTMRDEARKHLPSLDGLAAMAAMMTDDQDESATKTDDDEICCFPRVYQSYSLSVFADSYTAPDIGIAATFADATNFRRLGIYQSMSDPKESFTIAFLDIWLNGTLWVYGILPKEQICAVLLVEPDEAGVEASKLFDPCNVLPEAELLGTTTLGGGNQSIPVEIWIAADDMWATRLMLTPDVCAPVVRYSTETHDFPGPYSLGYTFNFDTSISDPSVFNVPSYCSNATFATPKAEWPKQLQRFDKRRLF